MSGIASFTLTRLMRMGYMPHFWKDLMLFGEKTNHKHKALSQKFYAWEMILKNTKGKKWLYFSSLLKFLLPRTWILKISLTPSACVLLSKTSHSASWCTWHGELYNGARWRLLEGWGTWISEGGVSFMTVLSNGLNLHFIFSPLEF